MRLVGLPPVAEEAVYRMQVGLGGSVDHVRVRRLADVLPLRQLVLNADCYLAEGVDPSRYAAKRSNTNDDDIGDGDGIFRGRC